MGFFNLFQWDCLGQGENTASTRQLAHLGLVCLRSLVLDPSQRARPVLYAAIGPAGQADVTATRGRGNGGGQGKTRGGTGQDTTLLGLDSSLSNDIAGQAVTRPPGHRLYE